MEYSKKKNAIQHVFASFDLKLKLVDKFSQMTNNREKGKKKLK